MRLTCRLLTLLFFAFAGTSHAGLITYSSQSSFQSAGTIAFNTNWDGFVGDYLFPATPVVPYAPYAVGGVTYVSYMDLILGPASPHGNPRSVMSNIIWTPLIATVAPGYDLLGFSGGVLSSNRTGSLVDVTVYTNQGTYASLNQAWPYATGALQFMGFATTSPGEIFTGFQLASVNGYGWGPVITDVQVGSMGTVPEPATGLLAGSALLALGALRRKRSA